MTWKIISVLPLNMENETILIFDFNNTDTDNDILDQGKSTEVNNTDADNDIFYQGKSTEVNGSQLRSVTFKFSNWLGFTIVSAASVIGILLALGIVINHFCINNEKLTSKTKNDDEFDDVDNQNQESKATDADYQFGPTEGDKTTKDEDLEACNKWTVRLERVLPVIREMEKNEF